MKTAAGKKVTLASNYGLLPEVTIIADRNTGEVSYRRACDAMRYNSGDYYVGLHVDRYEKRAWIDMEVLQD